MKISDIKTYKDIHKVYSTRAIIDTYTRDELNELISLRYKILTRAIKYYDGYNNVISSKGNKKTCTFLKSEFIPALDSKKIKTFDSLLEQCKHNNFDSNDLTSKKIFQNCSNKKEIKQEFAELKKYVAGRLIYNPSQGQFGFCVKYSLKENKKTHKAYLNVYVIQVDIETGELRPTNWSLSNCNICGTVVNHLIRKGLQLS